MKQINIYRVSFSGPFQEEGNDSDGINTTENVFSVQLLDKGMLFQELFYAPQFVILVLNEKKVRKI